MSPIGMSGIREIARSASAIPSATNPTKIQDAAEQFEALLIGQLLHSAKDKDAGWLGSAGDGSGDCATDFAEQQLAVTMAHQGGLGLAKLIFSGLERESRKSSL